MSNKFTGIFSLADGRKVFGTLSINGEQTVLMLFDESAFDPVPSFYEYISGELFDGRQITLLKCSLLGITSTGENPPKCSVSILPNYVLIGRARMPEHEEAVQELSFVMKNVSAVFYDFIAFSKVINPEPFKPLLKREIIKQHGRGEIGETPIISYFNGMYDIAITDTALGQISVQHQPEHIIGNASSVKFSNNIVIKLKPLKLLTFQGAMEALAVLSRFFGIILGSEQPLVKLNAKINNQKYQSTSVEIHRSFFSKPTNDGSYEENLKLGPREVLVSTVEGADKYSSILSNYLNSEEQRRESRFRMMDSFNSGHKYNIDRLISAANVFDIFPDSAYPKEVGLSDKVLSAKSQARDLFRQLPESPERASILNALGRIGKMTLKRKVRHRVQSTGLDEYFPRLMEVLDKAIDCRNHFVHGTPNKVDYLKNFDLVIFYTDALEFVFAASDLIDCGWSFPAWKEGHPGDRHPFGNFMVNYNQALILFDF